MHFFEAIGQDTVPREGKQHFCFSVPRKVSSWVSYCITEIFSTPVKNQYKRLSLKLCLQLNEVTGNLWGR